MEDGDHGGGEAGQRRPQIARTKDSSGGHHLLPAPPLLGEGHSDSYQRTLLVYWSSAVSDRWLLQV